MSQLARARAREEVPLMRRRAEQAWKLRWGAMLACAGAKAVASSLLDLLHNHGEDGKTSTTFDVESPLRGSFDVSGRRGGSERFFLLQSAPKKHQNHEP